MNPQIGNINKNANKILDAIDECSKDTDVLVTPELSIIGYPPMDILRREKLYDTQSLMLNRILEKTEGLDLHVIVGYCHRNNNLYNSAAVISEGEIVCKYHKQLLPTYDVFDGHRYFDTGDKQEYFTVKDTKIGLSICEDAWADVDVMNMKVHDYDPFVNFDENTELIINLSASPFRVGKNEERIDLFHEHAMKNSCPVVFCNQVGSNDELVFDGHSFIVDSNGNASSLKGFDSELKRIENLPINKNEISNSTRVDEIKEAITLGISDYFDKTGFSKAIVGMSGGVDSSVATALTVDALGSKNVIGVTMPSEITDDKNISDAKKVADNLDIEFIEIPIIDSVEQIKDDFERTSYDMEGIAMENIQARVRGDLLMSLSNTTNSLVITPDNKSEGAVGYCTLYGDTVGAIAPLGDCYKQYVYDIGETYNEIPRSIIEKEPSAELKEDQKDSDEMPEYEKLDQILKEYIEENKKPEDIKIPEVNVGEIVSQIHRSEFKRNQSPLPIRVTKKDFGRGWRYPISGDYSFLE